MKIGLIATSSITDTALFDTAETRLVATRYGDTPVRIGTFGAGQVVMVRRAGGRHPLEPGRINFRAMVPALRDVGVDAVVSTCVVGSLNPGFPPGTITAPAQFLDFTRHRPPTLFDEHGFSFTDMTEPYCPRLRGLIRKTGSDEGTVLDAHLCYVASTAPVTRRLPRS